MDASRAGNIQTILWDLDGTVLDSFGIYCELLTLIARNRGLNLPSREVMRMNFHGSLEDAIGHAFTGLPPETLTAIVTEFLSVQDETYEHIDGHLFGDALDLMKRMHAAGARNVLVTNREHAGRLKASPRHIAATTELGNYIDAIICGDDSEHRKPKPEVLGALRIEPQRTVVIGDQFVDAQFAHNLRARGVLVSREDKQPANMHLLDYDWQNSLRIVPSLVGLEL